ncbi:MAG TPA: S53 family peptidase [Solirubrobacterales bacterium]|nr:S53 family peptidase [Solirubrobacterales bacterium]
MKRLVVLFALALLVPAGASAAATSSFPLGKRQVTALFELRHPRGLNRFVRSVSDPRSPDYRQYATVEQLVARYGAKPQTRAKVLHWLARRGLRGKPTADGAFLLVRLPSAGAARWMPRAASATPGTLAARIGRRVPLALRGDVTRISLLPGQQAEPKPGPAAGPLPSAAAKKPKLPYFSIKEHSGTAGGCAAGSSGGIGPPFEPFTPNQYLTAYGYNAMHARGFQGQGETVAIVEGGAFKRSDVETFTRCFGSKAPPIAVVPLVSRKRLKPEDEPTLDVSMVAIGAPKLDRIVAYEGSETFEGLIETAGAALGSPGHRPDVISISYGFCEPYVSGGLSLRDAIDNVFAVAGGAGISVLASAGDQGSSGCRTFSSEGEETALATLAVQLPSSSAYATGVGGTNLILSKGNRIKSQIVWNDWRIQAAGGGGGASLLYPHTPWWQRSVHRYGLGRKVPDLAALADIYPGYSYFCSAASCAPHADQVFGWSSVGGTSAATPLTAAGVALTDQYLERRGQAPLGFLNPLLYQLGASRATRRQAFDDVTQGNNDIGWVLSPAAGGGHSLECCWARHGYDPASGWGSLRFPGFARAAGAAG